MEQNQNLPASKQDLIQLFQNLGVNVDSTAKVWMFQELSFMEKLITKRTIANFQKKIMESDFTMHLDARKAYQQLVCDTIMDELHEKRRQNSIRLNNETELIRSKLAENSMKIHTDMIDNLKPYIEKLIDKVMEDSIPRLERIEKFKGNPYYNIYKESNDKLTTAYIATYVSVASNHLEHYKKSIAETLGIHLNSTE